MPTSEPPPMRLMAFHAGGERIGDDPVPAPYFFYLVQHPDGNLLFDSGAHPALIDRPVDHLGADVAAQTDLAMGPGDDATSQLARAGLVPADITHVVQSHLHFDHAGGLDQFPHAKAYVHRAELAATQDPPPGQAIFYCARDYDHRSDWVILDGEHDVFGDGRVVAIPTPGHSPGHLALLVTLDSGPVILAADLAYRPEQFERRELSSVYSDPEAMLASYELIAALKDRLGARIIFTHDRTWRDSVRVAPDAWYE